LDSGELPERSLWQIFYQQIPDEDRMVAETINGAGMARIVVAEIFEIEAALAKPYSLSWGTLTTTRAVVLKLTDADGVVGWGEANPLQPFTVESPREAADVLIDELLPAVLDEACP
jgi:muconate cycloisomerase